MKTMPILYTGVYSAENRRYAADTKTLVVKLCRVKDFFFKMNATCRAFVNVDMGVEVKHRKNTDDFFLNFDPDGPDPVFLPLQIVY